MDERSEEMKMREQYIELSMVTFGGLDLNGSYKGQANLL